MAGRIAVVIPGIMGSTLFTENGSDERREIWSEHFAQNHRLLCYEPSLLRWSGQPAKSSLLENVYGPFPLPFVKIRLWRGLLRFLEEHQQFGTEGHTLKYSYDWRQSLLETAQGLGEQLTLHSRWLAEDKKMTTGELRYVFFTHSMGGLVVRIALGLGVLDPSAVNRLVHIGSPKEL